MDHNMKRKMKLHVGMETRLGWYNTFYRLLSPISLHIPLHTCMLNPLCIVYDKAHDTSALWHFQLLWQPIYVEWQWINLFIFSTGVPLLITLFNISQFRSVAWFNAAVGMTFIVLQFLMLRGESKWKRHEMTCKCKSRCGGDMKFNLKWVELFVSFLVKLGMFCSRYVSTVSYGILWEGN